MQFIHFQFGLFQRFPSSRRNPVNPPPATANILKFRTQESATLQSMKEGVKSSWTDMISVVFQFLHHGQSEDWLVNGVNQDVYPN